MRVRWREFELPNRVECENDTKSETFGRFVIEPFERGFGATIGNSLRRVLLSSIEGAAVVQAKIEGVDHEFTTKSGVFEDITHVILNMKQILVKLRDISEAELFLKKRGKGQITAGDLEFGDQVELINPDIKLATLTDNVEFNAILRVRRGRGYQTALENAEGENEIGTIWMDSTFSPITRVRYKVENTRVGQLTNYDRLLLDIWTNGTVSPENALVEGAKIFRKHLNPLVKYFELGAEVLQPGLPEAQEGPEEDAELKELLDRPISFLELSVRASNCLESENISTIRDLCRYTEDEVLKIRNFGNTSLEELKEKLSALNLTLGMLPRVASNGKVL
ncbi:MAG: DNA-directed RNA polymerase subunit alpha [Planctomycetes bacterium]|nr:DNA-directed RNA polymerase subunit alpha [Planctomycetota bacterium]